MKNFLIVLFFSGIFLVVGVLCLTKAEQLKQYLLRSIRDGTAAFNPFPKYVKSKGYIVVTRIIGVICILIALFSLTILLKGFVQ